MSTYKTRIVADAAALAEAAADYFVEAAQTNISAQGRFTVALSGGSTPKAMFELLAANPRRAAIAWEQVFVFWGDERCVPPDHADSNYRMTREALLSHVPLPQQNIFRMRGEAAPSEAAQEYAAQLRQFFQTEALPRWDVVFLGMGTDGHTASLFPGTSALHARSDEIVVANFVEKLQTHRLTLTAAAINQAHHVVFLVAGEDKAAPLQAVREGEYLPEQYPSQLIRPVAGELLWLIDHAAAGVSPSV